MKRTNKRQITQGLREIGAAWATQSAKYLCANHNCCQVLDGDRPAYHIHPDGGYPHQDDIKRFGSLVEIAGYIEACKQADQAGDDSQAMEIMQDFWASLS